MRELIYGEYGRILDSVCRHYGLECGRVIRSNKEECVDARATLVHACICKGFTESELVELTGLSQQCINKLRNSVRFREKRWAFNETLKTVMADLNQ